MTENGPDDPTRKVGQSNTQVFFTKRCEFLLLSLGKGFGFGFTWVVRGGFLWKMRESGKREGCRSMGKNSVSIFQGEIIYTPPLGGRGAENVEARCGGNLYATSSFLHPPPLEGYFQGRGTGGLLNLAHHFWLGTFFTCVQQGSTPSNQRQEQDIL